MKAIWIVVRDKNKGNKPIIRSKMSIAGGGLGG